MQSAAVRAAHEDDLPLLHQEGNPRSHDFNSATLDPFCNVERRANEYRNGVKPAKVFEIFMHLPVRGMDVRLSRDEASRHEFHWLRLIPRQNSGLSDIVRQAAKRFMIVVLFVGEK